MEDRSSSTNKYNDPKAPSLGPRQKQMEGEGLLHTCPAAYIPFLKIYSGYSLQCCRENPWPHGPSPSNYGQHHSERETSKCVSKPWEVQTCSSKPTKKPFLSWAEGVGAWNFWNKPITSPLLPKCVLLEGQDRNSLSFQLFRDTHSNMRSLELENQISFLIDFFSRWKCSSNCFLPFDLSISFA